ncbi:hypothetical protein HPB51_019099 [Rhipicephalus microplus]|uniref:Uncharacterized protein n=1 Tax=Rhipicephalus microplus TaxID=6941 RepID=A0A9J6EI60_RHIMP|nr:hypothetical protein HPB51_019099 [Rhipicephalus microplus]
MVDYRMKHSKQLSIFVIWSPALQNVSEDGEAVALCRYVLCLDPADPMVICYCVVGLRELGKYKEAARMQRRAFVLRLHLAESRALYRCSVGLRELGEYTEVARMPRRGFTLKPHSEHVIDELVLLEEDEFVELTRHKICAALEALNLSATRRRLSIEQVVDPYTRRDIDKYLHLLKTVGSPGYEFEEEQQESIRKRPHDMRRLAAAHHPISGTV